MSFNNYINNSNSLQGWPTCCGAPGKAACWWPHASLREPRIFQIRVRKIQGFPVPCFKIPFQTAETQKAGGSTSHTTWWLGRLTNAIALLGSPMTQRILGGDDTRRWWCAAVGNVQQASGLGGMTHMHALHTCTLSTRALSPHVHAPL